MVKRKSNKQVKPTLKRKLKKSTKIGIIVFIVLAVIGIILGVVFGVIIPNDETEYWNNFSIRDNGNVKLPNYITNIPPNKFKDKTCAQLFLHYVNQNGPYKKHAYDQVSKNK